MLYQKGRLILSLIHPSFPLLEMGSKYAPWIISSGVKMGDFKSDDRKVKDRMQLGRENHIIRPPLAALLGRRSLSFVELSKLLSTILHHWNWDIVIVTILMYLRLDGLYCCYSCCISCPVSCCYCPVHPFIHLRHIIGLLCCSACFLIPNNKIKLSFHYSASVHLLGFADKIKWKK